MALRLLTNEPGPRQTVLSLGPVQRTELANEDGYFVLGRPLGHHHELVFDQQSILWVGKTSSCPGLGSFDPAGSLMSEGEWLVVVDGDDQIVIVG